MKSLTPSSRRTAEKEGKEVIDFKGKPMLVKFGYILTDSLDEIRDGEN